MGWTRISSRDKSALHLVHWRSARLWGARIYRLCRIDAVRFAHRVAAPPTCRRRRNPGDSSGFPTRNAGVRPRGFAPGGTVCFAMRVESLHLQNFRCFKELKLSLAKHVTLLVAPNGGGKTALLDGLATALGGLGDSMNVPLGAPMAHRDVRRTYPIYADSVSSVPHYPATVDAFLEFEDGTKAATFCTVLDGAEWLRRPGMTNRARQWIKERIEEDRKEVKTRWPVIAYYRVGRARVEGDGFSSNGDEKKTEEKKAAPYPDPERVSSLAQYGTDKSSIPERKHGWQNALNAAADWRKTKNWWAFEYVAAAAEGRGRSAMCRVVEGAVSQSLAETKWVPRWSPPDRDILVWVDELGAPRPVGMLSDGYRSTVALFADLARRCAILNPHLLAEAARETPGIVLIDEVDLHLHPAWQRRFITDLRKAFPAIQFVLTTHSPQVISGASAVLSKDNDKLLFLDTHGHEEPQPVELPEPVGLLADKVLTGPWFRLNTSLDSETVEIIEEHRRLTQKERPTKKDKGRQAEIEEFLRSRLGRFYETHLDEVVHRVVGEYLKDKPKPTWEEIEQAGKVALELLRTRK